MKDAGTAVLTGVGIRSMILILMALILVNPTSVIGAGINDGVAHASAQTNVDSDRSSTVATTTTEPGPGVDTLSTWYTSIHPIFQYGEGVRVVQYNGYIYYLGGVENSTYSNYVYRAQVISTGEITGWTSQSSLVTARAMGGALASGGYIYYVGGVNSGGYSGTTYYAVIDAGGNIGTWNTGPTLPLSWAHGTLALCNGYLYAISGIWNSIFDYKIYQSRLTGGVPGSWSMSPNPLPTYRGYLSYDNLVYNNRIYVPGGFDGTNPTQTVYYGACSAGGGIPSWYTTTHGLPAPKEAHTAVIDTNRGQIYTIAGRTTSGTHTKTVHYATINPSTGNIDSPWSSGPDIPAVRRFAGATFTPSQAAVHVFGGHDGAYARKTVYYGFTNVRPAVPIIQTPWDSQKSGEWASPMRPEFIFSGSDLDGDDIRYNLQIATDATFTTLNVNATSGSNSGFTDITNPGDLDPFGNGHWIKYVIPFNMSAGTYWWRVKATDPFGSTLSSSFSSPRSITVQAGMGMQRFFQTTKDQFNTDTLGGAAIPASSGDGSVELGGTKITYDTFSDLDYTTNPVWTAVSGTWSAANGYLEASNIGENKISTPTTFSPSNSYCWESRFKFESLTGTAWNRWYLMVNYPDPSPYTGTNGYFYELGGTGQFKLNRQDGSSIASIISTSWSQSIAWRTSKACREPNGLWSIYVDGVLKGTVTDTTYTTSNYVAFRDAANTVSENVYHDDIYMNQTELPGSANTDAIVYTNGPSGKVSWNALTWSKDVTYGSVTVAVQKYTSSWVWTGIQGTSSPLSLTSLGTTTQIRLMANLTYAGGSPKLLDWEVSWLSTPTSPQNLVASPGNKKITLTWSAPLDDGGATVNAYRLYRGTSSGGEKFLVMLSGSSLSYVDNPLKNGVMYYYKASARNSNGVSLPSNEASATPAKPPNAPRTLTALPGNSNATLNWWPPNTDGGSPVTLYKVYRSPDGISFAQIDSTSFLTYLNTGLTNGFKYYYKVSAVNAMGEGAQSTAVNATPIGPPSAPLGMGSGYGKTYATIWWSAPSDNGGAAVTSYKIYRGTSAGGETFFLSVSASSLSYTDTLVDAGVTYYYKVSAVNVGGEGPKGSEASAKPYAEPGEPRNLVATSGNSEIVLTWNAPLSDGGYPISSYVIYRGTSSGGEVIYNSVASDTFTFADDGADAGTTYFYYLIAGNTPGEFGPPSSEVNATAKGVPSAPTLVSAIGGSMKVTLAWTSPSSNGGSPITSYQIWRGTTPGGAKSFLISVSGSATSGTDWWVTPGVTYYYMVRAVNAAGPGDFSNEMSAVATASAPLSIPPENGPLFPMFGIVALAILITTMFSMTARRITSRRASAGAT